MKKFLGFSVIAAAVVAVSSFFLAGQDFTVRIAEKDVAGEIAARLPVTVERHGVKAVVKEANVDFRKDNAVAVKATVDLEGYGLSGVASVDAVTGVLYRNGEFFLSDVSVENVGIGFDKESASKVADAKSLVSSLWESVKSAAEDAAPGGASALEKAREAAEARVVPAAKEAIETALRNTPVYSLNGKTWKHQIASLALRDLAFEDTHAVAVLDIGTLAWKILVIAFLGVLGILVSIGVAAAVFLPRR